MGRRRGSALLSALFMLLVVTLFSLSAMEQIAQWRADEQRLLIHEKQTFDQRFDVWSTQQNATTTSTKD
ncbi:hypothetical protein [Lacticaseibacillus porcinae]|uniref:hypothetical protein n=1 Tax=Lacticaseibacillus porcinae TaxID=1123687 RepID=UPI000F77E195|nr:hypothetical protein [Lacticaseibacillus porcinae]